jgi:hypothetical protein
MARPAECIDEPARTWLLENNLRGPALVGGEQAADLLKADPAPRHLLADKGFHGRAFAASQAARGIAVLAPPGKNQRATIPSILLKVIAEWRNRIEATFSEITD